MKKSIKIKLPYNAKYVSIAFPFFDWYRTFSFKGIKV